MRNERRRIASLRCKIPHQAEARSISLVLHVARPEQRRSHCGARSENSIRRDRPYLKRVNRVSVRTIRNQNVAHGLARRLYCFRKTHCLRRTAVPGTTEGPQDVVNGRYDATVLGAAMRNVTPAATRPRKPGRVLEGRESTSSLSRPLPDQRPPDPASSLFDHHVATHALPFASCLPARCACSALQGHCTRWR